MRIEVVGIERAYDIACGNRYALVYGLIQAVVSLRNHNCVRSCMPFRYGYGVVGGIAVHDDVFH
jgi:hypothetical protein